MNDSNRLNNNIQQDLLEAVLAAMPEPFFIYDQDGKFIDVLGGSDRGKYHDARHLIGKTLYDLFSKRKADHFVAQIRKALKAETVVSFDYSVTPEEVEDYKDRLGPVGQQWFEAHISPIKTENGLPQLVVWMAVNITEHKKAMELEKKLEKKLQKLALTDPLTGLLNRRGFFEKTQRMLERWGYEKCDGPAVLIFDIDYFKLINDNFGHHVGDIILKSLTKELIGSLRSVDIVGRVGGDEFAIVLSGCQAQSAESIAERIRLRIANLELLIENNVIHFTISIGVSVYQNGDGDIQNAVRRADAAMYRAKVVGRNQVCVAE